MVKQLGVPTPFMTFLSADLKWNEQAFIIKKPHKLDLSEENTRYFITQPFFLPELQFSKHDARN